MITPIKVITTPLLSLLILMLTIGIDLSAQETGILPELPCPPLMKNYKLDSLMVVADCTIDGHFQWSLAWGKGGNYMLIKSGDRTILWKSHEEGEEGYIIRAKFYRSAEMGLYYILAVFGMEDGDISIKVFSLENDLLHHYGNIQALTLGSEGDYNYAPLETLKLLELQAGQIDIHFPNQPYQIVRERKLHRWTGPLHYRLVNGKMKRQQ